MDVPLIRRLLAELVGTGLLVTVVVGSGIAAQTMSPGQHGLQLLMNSVATALGLTALILMVGPVSGGHLNPVVTAAAWALGRGRPGAMTTSTASAYVVAQLLGGLGGVVLANAMFEVGTRLSTRHRVGEGPLIGEVVATAGLVALVFALVRSHRGALVAPAVGAWIGAAYWFTSSTAFANPAVTLGRVFTDTFAGIGPISAVLFVVAQGVGLVVGLALTLAWYPDAPAVAEDVAVPRSVGGPSDRG